MEARIIRYGPIPMVGVAVIVTGALTAARHSPRAARSVPVLAPRPPKKSGSGHCGRGRSLRLRGSVCSVYQIFTRFSGGRYISSPGLTPKAS